MKRESHDLSLNKALVAIKVVKYPDVLVGSYSRKEGGGGELCFKNILANPQ